MTPDGDSVYVADEDNDAVLVLDTASNTVVRTVPVGGNSFDLAVTPDGRRAYVTLYRGGLVEIDITTGAARPVGSDADGLGVVAVAPDGRFVYVARNGSAELSAMPVPTA